jgi:hypothetical protein
MVGIMGFKGIGRRHGLERVRLLLGLDWVGRESSYDYINQIDGHLYRSSLFNHYDHHG